MESPFVGLIEKNMYSKSKSYI